MDPLLPKQMRYQAALHSDVLIVQQTSRQVNTIIKPHPYMKVTTPGIDAGSLAKCGLIMVQFIILTRRGGLETST